ncbi:MAG: hypothetical protein AB8H86_31030 [Polyangiales bacterium]
MDESTPHSWIGDPTVLGWSVTVAYLLTFLLLTANALKARSRNEPFSFWAFSSVIILALGVNKQLDLQTWFGASAKTWVQAQGLYEHRRTLQLAFVVTLAVGGLIVLWLLRRWIVRSGKRYRLVALGLAVSGVFVVTRAASIHVLDRLLGSADLTEALAATLEISALALMIFGAIRWRRRPKTLPERSKKGRK